MKKLGLAVAMVLGMASAAQAQTTQVINATATIDQVLTLEQVDNAFECGTVTYASTTCTGASTASVRVKANADWTLTMADDGGNGANLVRMTNSTLPNTGAFNINLEWSEATTEATCSLTTCGGVATPVAGVVVDIIDVAGSIPNGTLLSTSSLATDDEHGAYTGSFTATLAAL